MAADSASSAPQNSLAREQQWLDQNHGAVFGVFADASRAFDARRDELVGVGAPPAVAFKFHSNAELAVLRRDKVIRANAWDLAAGGEWPVTMAPLPIVAPAPRAAAHVAAVKPPLSDFKSNHFSSFSSSSSSSAAAAPPSHASRSHAFNGAAASSAIEILDSEETEPEVRIHVSAKFLLLILAFHSHSPVTLYSQVVRTNVELERARLELEQCTHAVGEMRKKIRLALTDAEMDSLTASMCALFIVSTSARRTLSLFSLSHIFSSVTFYHIALHGVSFPSPGKRRSCVKKSCKLASTAYRLPRSARYAHRRRPCRARPPFRSPPRASIPRSCLQ